MHSLGQISRIRRPELDAHKASFNYFHVTDVHSLGLWIEVIGVFFFFEYNVCCIKILKNLILKMKLVAFFIVLTINIHTINIHAKPTKSNHRRIIESNPHITDQSQCYICHEENGTFPNGGPCTIDSLIETCEHEPPCRTNPDWRCGHIFCKNCITAWKDSWTDMQRQRLLNRPTREHNVVQFYCPRCMKRKGCDLMNAMNILIRQPVARVRHQLGIEPGGLIADDFFLIDQILNQHIEGLDERNFVALQPPHISLTIMILIISILHIFVALYIVQFN